MNVDAVIKRLEALEDKIIGTRHVEAVLIYGLTPDGKKVPCFDSDSFRGRYVAVEHVFCRRGKQWIYQPNEVCLDDYRKYCPPDDYRKSVIVLVRRGKPESGEESRRSIETAMQAVSNVVNDDNNQ